MPSSTTTTTQNPDLHQALLDIGLRGIAAQIDDFLARVIKQRLGPVALLEELARIEALDRGRRGLERRQARSRIGAFKPMADFDWNWPAKIDRDLVERALALRFIDEAVNVILVGAHGLGKTMILKNMGHQAVLNGHSVLLVTAGRLLTDLSSQDTSRALERRLKYYCNIKLLCIDEIGYLSYDSRGADMLFEVVSRRYAARKPIALTTNLAFSDWNVVFPEATCTVALIDRLTHRADIMSIEGKSWRKKEAEERQRNRNE